MKQTPWTLDIEKLANGIERMGAIEDAWYGHSVRIALGVPAAIVVAEALHALARHFEEAEPQPGERSAWCAVWLGENGRLAAVAAVRALADGPKRGSTTEDDRRGCTGSGP